MGQATGGILCVEDSVEDFSAMARAFSRAGIEDQLMHVTSGEAALARLFDTVHPRPSLILLDLGMPGLGGKDVLSIIKRDPALREIPVVIITHAAGEAALRSCYALGANAFLTKPDTPDALTESLQTLKKHWLDTVALPPAAASAPPLFNPAVIPAPLSPSATSALTPREIETLTLAAQGKNRRETATLMGVSEDTVKTHLERSRCKLNAASTVQAVALALLQGALAREEIMAAAERGTRNPC